MQRRMEGEEEKARNDRKETANFLPLKVIKINEALSDASSSKTCRYN